MWMLSFLTPLTPYQPILPLIQYSSVVSWHTFFTSTIPSWPNGLWGWPYTDLLNDSIFLPDPICLLPVGDITIILTLSFVFQRLGDLTGTLYSCHLYFNVWEISQTHWPDITCISMWSEISQAHHTHITCISMTRRQKPSSPSLSSTIPKSVNTTYPGQGPATWWRWGKTVLTKIMNSLSWWRSTVTVSMRVEKTTPMQLIMLGNPNFRCKTYVAANFNLNFGYSCTASCIGVFYFSLIKLIRHFRQQIG